MQPLLPTIVYSLCFLTSAACAWLLVRSYRRTRARLLLWSSLCFLFLAANNLVVILDMLVIAHIDLRLPRLLLALGGVAVLLFGFIWDQGEE